MSLIEWVKVFVLGIVEGITEWLPISSSGHLMLVGNLLKLNVSDAFMEMFNVVIQLGAIMAVVVLYFNYLWPFHTNKINSVRSCCSHSVENMVPKKFRRLFVNQYFCIDKIVMWLKIAISCIPGLLVGLSLNDWLKKHIQHTILVAVMLIVYGVLFLLVEQYNQKKKPRISRISQITCKDALVIGFF